MDFKHTSKFLLAVVFILFFSCVGSAQPPKNTEKQVEHLKQQLDLTEDQTARIQDILVRSHEEFSKLRKENEDQREAMRGVMQDLREDTDRQIKSVLNEDQQAAFEKMREDRHRDRPHRGHRDGGKRHDRDPRD